MPLTLKTNTYTGLTNVFIQVAPAPDPVDITTVAVKERRNSEPIKKPAKKSKSRDYDSDDDEPRNKSKRRPSKPKPCTK